MLPPKIICDEATPPLLSDFLSVWTYAPMIEDSYRPSIMRETALFKVIEKPKPRPKCVLL
jgi:hypothetical protein